ncbi:MAG: hypothetical protein JNJ57_20795 [Saprospiraceae bacterium]|nr:hypothetical protein [Saprospiraceae bacterium]
MKYYLVLLLILSTSFIVNCGKEKEKITVIRGTVLDEKSMAPISGAGASAVLYSKGIPTELFYQMTDNQGQFNAELGEDEFLSGLEVRKEGYLPALGFSTIQTKINDYEYDYKYLLTPLDGALRIVYSNNQLDEKSIYLQTQTQSLLNTYSILPFTIPKPYPFLIGPMSTDSVQVTYPSNEMVYVYWDILPFSKVMEAAHRDSFFLAQGDTAVYRVML